jgi:hypothetical protein
MEEKKLGWMGELKLSEDVELESTPTEFPMQMTFIREDEETKQKVSLPHIHVTSGFTSPIIHIAPFEEVHEESEKTKKKEKSEIGSIIDYLKEKKVLSEEDKERISIILNLTNDIKDLCKDGVDMVKTDVNFFYKLIKKKWEQAVNDIKDIDSVGKNEL